MDNNKKISEEEAIKLLTKESNREEDISIFDAYGNYNYPFEVKLSTQNTAVGYVGKNNN